MPSLRMLRGPEPGRLYELEDETVTIGRGRRNQVIIHDNEVSREHCRLVRASFDYEIFDLGSTNGTFLNGRPVSEAQTPIFNKNIIELGDSIVLEYVASREGSDTSDTKEFLVPSIPQAVPVSEVSAAQPPPSLLKASLIVSDFYLVLRRRNQNIPEVYLLDSPVIDIGRHLDNTICLSESQVSRFHVRLARMDYGYNCEDLGSVNGTIINGERADTPRLLKPGDHLLVGHIIDIWYTDNLETLKMVPRAEIPSKPTTILDAPVTGGVAVMAVVSPSSESGGGAPMPERDQTLPMPPLPPMPERQPAPLLPAPNEDASL